MTSKNEDKMYMGKNRDLNVYPINIDEDKLGEDDDRYPLPNKVHFNVFLGSIRSGKSTLLNSMYLSPRFMGGDMYDVRILISATALDDAMSESGITQKKAGKSDKFTQLITRYRHVGSKVLGTEGRLAICVCLQFFKYLTPALRNQIQGLFLMGSFPEAELNKIAESYSFMGGSKKAFVELFNKSKEGEYDFTYINVPRLQMWRNFTELLYDKKNNFSVVPIEQFKNADTRRKEGTDVEEPSESEGGKGKKKRRGKKGTDTDKPVLSVIKA